MKLCCSALRGKRNAILARTDVSIPHSWPAKETALQGPNPPSHLNLQNLASESRYEDSHKLNLDFLQYITLPRLSPRKNQHTAL